MKKRVLKFSLLFLLSLVVLGFLMPQQFVMPVEGAGRSDYHPDSFWYYPWGKSGTHKGIDVFAKKGTPVLSSTSGIVLYTGEFSMGGKVVLVLGPKWRVHYYAHLESISTRAGRVTGSGKPLGTVGDSGNAIGKSPHLHYSILSIFPYPWRIDGSIQGWKKMFYLNPIDYL